MAVDDDIGKIAQRLGGAIEARIDLLQLGMLADEIDGGATAAKFRMRQHILEKADIGGDAANAKFAQRPVGALDRPLQAPPPGGDLDQQRIEKGRDLGARIGGADVETDAETAGAAIGDQATEVGLEIPCRIFGGNAALHRETVAGERLLRFDADLRIAQTPPVGDVDLTADDIDAGHLLGDGVLHLHPRIDLDEIVVLLAVDEKLDGTGIDIADMAHDAQRVVEKALPRRLRKGRVRRHLDDLLEASLDGAVAFEQVDDLAVGVGQNLHLDMLRRIDEFLQKYRVVAEGLERLAARLGERLFQLGLVAQHPHAATATTGNRLEHQRKPDAPRLPERRLQVIERFFAGLDDRQSRLPRRLFGRHLVAEQVEHPRRRADENDARLLAAPREVDIFREKAIARMDGVDAMPDRDIDDGVDIEIGLQGFVVGADLVGFVCLVAVRRKAVLVRVDGDRLQLQFGGGPQNAYRDLATVGDQDFLDSGLHVLLLQTQGPTDPMQYT